MLWLPGSIPCLPNLCHHGMRAGRVTRHHHADELERATLCRATGRPPPRKHKRRYFDTGNHGVGTTVEGLYTILLPHVDFSRGQFVVTCSSSRGSNAREYRRCEAHMRRSPALRRQTATALHSRRLSYVRATAMWMSVAARLPWGVINAGGQWGGDSIWLFLCYLRVP